MKFVNYTILMKRVPGLETEPAIIERRYSEFRNFYNAIKRKYPLLLKDVIFPKKIFIEVIAERSMAFQKFLTYCLSLSEIRSSKEFAQFLYHPELKEKKRPVF
ncbi:sorting nexin-20-like protein [Euroglyphus maynei]|uniref:Sorting nexin-20-like protein n=1 Tax=Euroglyphus maynei TaxID=6958 RepID=A0A1Y3B0Z9_EURMA|nr:sorting nexin-20-like protein [Euroglyphus maynei]